MVTLGDGRFYNILHQNIQENKIHDRRQNFHIKDMSSTFYSLSEIYEDALKKYTELFEKLSHKGECLESMNICRKAKNIMDISDHSSTRILQLATQLDIIAANSENSRDEIFWLNPICMNKFDVKIIPHGLEVYSTEIKDEQIIIKIKESAKRKIIRRLNETKGIYISKSDKYEGVFNIKNNKYQPYIFLKISRPIPCKAFDRDILVCSKLSEKIGDNNALFIVVSHWDINQQKNPIHDWISEAQEAKLPNISFCFINQFNWPLSNTNLFKSLSRNDLLLAADVSFSQSRYESFGLSQIEPLQFGTICIVSGISGVRSRLNDKNINFNQLDSPLIVADYTFLENNSLPNSESEIFSYDWEKFEQQVAMDIANQIYNKLECRKYADLYKKGREITITAFDWNDITEEFINIIKS